jgi:tripartite-type tricarboxylate transporter receptor subunit TctC
MRDNFSITNDHIGPQTTGGRRIGWKRMTALTRRTLLVAGAASLGAAASAHAQSPAWPTRPLRIIIPTAPGGSPDMVARLLGNKLTERLGQPVVVESIVQGVGLVGNQTVSRSTPDGSTFAMLTGGFTTQAAVMKSLPYDPLQGFAFVTTVVAYPMFLLVAPDSPIKSFAEFIDRAKREQGQMNYAIIGSGSVYHLLGKWIENQSGMELVGIPYRGSIPALTDMLGGRVAAMLDTATSAISRIKSGQVRALAVSSPEPYALMPEVPTMNETVPGIKLMSWLGLATAPQTPRPIIDKLNAEVRHALDQPDVKKWLAETGVMAAPCTPEEFRQQVEAEIALYTKIAEANGIKV